MHDTKANEPSKLDIPIRAIIKVRIDLSMLQNVTVIGKKWYTLFTCNSCHSFRIVIIGNLNFSQHPLYIAYNEEEEQRSNQSTPLHKRYAHDIALVELDRSVDIQSPYTRAICLPPVGDAIFGNDFDKREPGSLLMHDNTVDLFDVERKGQCWVTGWGYTADQGIHLCWFIVIWVLDWKNVVFSLTFNHCFN